MRRKSDPLYLRRRNAANANVAAAASLVGHFGIIGAAAGSNAANNPPYAALGGFGAPSSADYRKSGATASCYGCIEGGDEDAMIPPLGGALFRRRGTSAVDLASAAAADVIPLTMAAAPLRSVFNSSLGSVNGIALRSASYITSGGSPAGGGPSFSSSRLGGAIPHLAHYNDSGFSSFSSCTFLPPPPPYKGRSGTASASSNNLSCTGGGGASSPDPPTLRGLGGGQPSSLYQILSYNGGGADDEYTNNNNNNNKCNNNDNSRSSQILRKISTKSDKTMISTTANDNSRRNNIDGVGGGDSDGNSNNNNGSHRIHRSLSDSKYVQQRGLCGKNNNNRLQRSAGGAGYGGVAASSSTALVPPGLSEEKVALASTLVELMASQMSIQQQQQQQQYGQQPYEQQKQQHLLAQYEQEQQQQQQQHQQQTSRPLSQPMVVGGVPSQIQFTTVVSPSTTTTLQNNSIANQVPICTGFYYGERQQKQQQQQQQQPILLSVPVDDYESRMPYAHTRIGGSLGSYGFAAADFNNNNNNNGSNNNNDSRGGDSSATASWLTTAASSTSLMSLSPSPSMSTVSCPEYPEFQEKLHRLAMARDSLSVQVAMLNEQVDAQKEKIRDLECTLDANKQAAGSGGGGGGGGGRSGAGSSSYRIASEQSLIEEIGELKRRFTALEREKTDAERRLHLSHAEIERLGESMQNVVYSQQQQQQKQASSNRAVRSRQHNRQQESTLNDSMNTANDELDQLRSTVQRLIADNQLKTDEINALRSALDEQTSRARQLECHSQRSSTNATPASTSATPNGVESAGGGACRRVSSSSSSTATAGAPLVQPQQQQHSLDINAQLRRLLLMEDDDETDPNRCGGGPMAHSSSYPTSLCNSVHQTRSAYPPATSNYYNAAADVPPAQMMRYGMSSAMMMPSSVSYASAMSSAAECSAQQQFQAAAAALWAASSAAEKPSLSHGGGAPPPRVPQMGAPRAIAPQHQQQRALSPSRFYAFPAVSPSIQQQQMAAQLSTFYGGVAAAAAAVSASEQQQPPPNYTSPVVGAAFRNNASPAAARQLAAELDALRRSADYQQQLLFHQQPMGGSLPRILHSKSNSAIGSATTTAQLNGGPQRTSSSTTTTPRPLHGESRSKSPKRCLPTTPNRNRRPIVAANLNIVGPGPITARLIRSGSIGMTSAFNIGSFPGSEDHLCRTELRSAAGVSRNGRKHSLGATAPTAVCPSPVDGSSNSGSGASHQSGHGSAFWRKARASSRSLRSLLFAPLTRRLRTGNVSSSRSSHFYVADEARRSRSITSPIEPDAGDVRRPGTAIRRRRSTSAPNLREVRPSVWRGPAEEEEDTRSAGGAVRRASTPDVDDDEAEVDAAAIFAEMESDDEMVRSMGAAVGGPSPSCAARRSTDGGPATGRRRATAAKKVARGGRARSTLRSLFSFGRLTRSTSQEIGHQHHQRDAALMEDGGVAATSTGTLSARTPSAIGNGGAMRDRFDDIRRRPSTADDGGGGGSRAEQSSMNGGGEPAPPVRPRLQQFIEWTAPLLGEWFRAIGMGQYASEAQRYLRSGRHLLNLSALEMEKELQIKCNLHRKRLGCLLDAIERNNAPSGSPPVQAADRMDIHQVMLWLDDIGLPQLRDAFAAHHIDGQMLLRLTAQDLLELRVTSAMNHATLARAIQLLRAINFNVHRLEKHYAPEFAAGARAPTSADVELWTHGCVAEWLRGIDLTEFTPHLAFSGVHGALLVHEPTFTAESLAEVLRIPAHKTLLRRHLTTHFNNILGPAVIGHKREVLAQPFVGHLSPALRIKLSKKSGVSNAGGFSVAALSAATRKRSKQDIFVDPDVPVCPHSGASVSAAAVRTSGCSDDSGGATVARDLITTSNV